jgi:hypothetical protein
MTAIDPASDQPATRDPQPGWYHDPAVADGSSVRWWTGAAWSEHTRPVLTAPAPPAASTPVRSTFAPAPIGAAGGSQQSAAVAARRVMHNGTAWVSFSLGLLALSVALLVLVGHRTSILISSSGIVAIITGVRAIRLRSLGFANVFVPAVLGIVFGGLGTLLMLGMLLAA